MKKKYYAQSINETETIAIEFAKTLRGGECICLYGEMGVGKTTFTQGLAKGLGAESRVISPTFSIVRQHAVKSSGIKTLYHLDLYRLEKENDIKGIGIDEILSDVHTVTVIEWAERMQALLPEKRIEIKMTSNDSGKRDIEIISIS